MGVGRVGQAVGRLAVGDALHQKGHVLRHVPDGFDPFLVGVDVVGGVAVDVVPIGGRDSGHAADAEELVHLFEDRTVAGAPARDDGRADLHVQIEVAAVKQPLEKGEHRAVGRAEVNRRAEDDAVSGCQFRRRRVDDVVEDASAGGFAFAAADAPVDRLVADDELFGCDPAVAMVMAV